MVARLSCNRRRRPKRGAVRMCASVFGCLWQPSRAPTRVMGASLGLLGAACAVDEDSGRDAMVRSGTPDGADGQQSLGELVSLAAKDISSLVRYEISLAKSEMRMDARRIGIAAAFAVVG